MTPSPHRASLGCSSRSPASPPCTLAALTLERHGRLRRGPRLAAAADSRHAKPTIVLVHGAFADSSGWNDVAARLI